ncbi:NAD(P)/FAD-dependent oxidoreductase [Nocardia callitridis]|uniref:FAD-dependent oxidoreductase n=1 Tax=Nocardia callitridis TaxID=648753 RepID=A0ABP9K2Q0_9NOCA
MSEQHRIVVLGAGYGGLSSARRLVRKARGARITVVDTRTRFVERVRLHQRAAGQDIPAWDLAAELGRKGIEFIQARATEIDTEGRRVLLDPVGAGDRESVGYDTLIYALGSGNSQHSVAGVSEHAYSVSTPEDAEAIVCADALDGKTVAIVGNGSTGIELAAELGESQPNTRVLLLGSEEAGAWLSPRGCAHVGRTLARLGVETYAQVKVIEVTSAGVRLADGRLIEADATVWTAGFGVPDLAARSGFEVDASGRVVTDATLRSVSHPEVFAVGDSAVVVGSDGKRLRMACATALPTGKYAADVVIAQLRGKPLPELKFRFVAQCVSLGRKDGVIQALHADDSPGRFAVTGRAAGWLKEQVVLGAGRSVRV